MTSADTLTNALDTAIATAHDEYRKAVIEVAMREAAKGGSANDEPANVDRIHQARTRVIALDAAREELIRMIDEGVAPTST